MSVNKNILAKVFWIYICSISIQANATGVLPDTTLLNISEESGMAQMGIQNTENEPLLLVTTIVDLSEDKDVTVLALPAITRIEANGRQIVRFALNKSDVELKVQHLKRVIFEGIPTANVVSGKNVVRVTVRQDLPVVISPLGLKLDPEPWKYLGLKSVDKKLTMSNPSAYVIRLSQVITVVPNSPAINILPRNYILPGESFSVDLATEIPEDIKFLRIYPASPFGFDVPSFEAPLNR